MVIYKFKLVFFVLVVCTSFSGCWSIIGVEDSLVRHDSVNMTFVYSGIAVSILCFIIQVLSLKRKESNEHLFNKGLETIFLSLYSFTIIGAWNSWIFSSLSHWNNYGIYLCISGAFIMGIRGIFPIMGFLLYWLYEDENLLYFFGIPHIIGFVIFTFLLFLRAKSIINTSSDKSE